jgi:hypothetical protein
VTNYLHRPLLPAIGRALAPDGIMIYENGIAAIAGRSAGCRKA